MRNSTSLVFGLAAALLAGLSANGTGCTSSQPGQLSGGTGMSTGASMSTGTGSASKVDPKPLFEAIEADLVAQCGTCHEPGGLADRPFLALPDRYESMISWPGIVTKPSTGSLFISYPISGGSHTGKNLDAPDLKDTLMPKVQAWLDAEAAAIADPIDMQKSQIAPVAPIMGFNAIYLTPLSAELEGVAITFNADAITPTTLKLTDVQVHTTTKTGVHIIHPIFVVFPVGADPDPDPVDNFSGFDSYFEENTSSDLGAGTVLLDNWKASAKLSIVFESVEPFKAGGMGGGGGGTTGGGGCKDVTEFTNSAAPQFQQRCFGCHGGANAMANAAVDMSKLMTDPAAACGQIRNRVNPGNPGASQIFVTTDPNGNAAHPYKFGGNTGQFDTFVSNVSTWITAEQ